jgi:hypothetical protein
VVPGSKLGLTRNRGTDHRQDSSLVDLGSGEMDQVYRELDRLFAEYWQGTERKTVLTGRRVLKNNQLDSGRETSLSMITPGRSTGNGAGKE